MTSFTYTWNATFLATPADTEDEALGAQRIRDTKAAVGERLAVDHSMAGNSNDGKHVWATLENIGSTTAMVLDSGDGRLFAASVTGITELFYQDSLGHIVQLTANGSVSAPITAPVIPSGTNMVFVQTAVPAGWVLRTDLNDQLLRTNHTFGGTVGGSWVISGVSTQGHVLTVNELPAHDHGLAGYTIVVTNAPSPVGTANPGTILGTVVGQSVGGGAAHDHGACVGDGNWRPVYVDVIVGTKS